MELLCDSIVKNSQIGIYDGAYKCVELAREISGSDSTPG